MDKHPSGFINPTGTKWIFTGDDYKLENKLDADCVDALAQDKEYTITITKENTLEKIYEMREMGGSGMFKDPAYAPYMHCCDVEEAELGGADFHERAEPHKCFIHRKKGSKGTKPAMVYWHGGGGVAGKASSLHPMMNRVAIESDIVVFNCNYGLAPERVAPLGITDAYAQLCQILQTHKKYDIDPERVFIAGESGGGYIVAGVALMLAEKSESSSVKFQFQMIPQVDDCFEKDEITPPFTEEELAYKGFMRGINAIHKENNSCSDYWIWPNLAPDSLVKKCPPALILTTEFDMFRRGSENAAKLFLRNDKLIEFGILKGTYHAHFYDFNCGRTAAWFEAIKVAIDVHLR